MLKFRDYIYCDNERVSSYIGQIEELKKNPVSTTKERDTTIGGNLNVGVAKGESLITEKTFTNYSLNTSSLEQIVNWSYNEKNAINYNGEDLFPDDKDKLIVISGVMTIPEMSENMEIINALVKNNSLFNAVKLSDEDKEKMSYIKESDNVPILLDANASYIFSCNLKRECLFGITDIVEYIDSEITIIGRIDRIFNSDEDVEIYNLAKEVFKLNRAMIRKMPKESLKDALIYEKGPLVKITPIIIYK